MPAKEQERSAATETLETAVLGGEGELCGGCGAPLAADQRYCLNCGRRRAPHRVDPEERLRAAAPAAVAATVAEPAGEPLPAVARPREASPMAAVGGIAVLGLMLLAGVLIGRGEGPATTTAPPQVVTVDEGASSTAASGSGGKESKPAQDAAKKGSKDDKTAGGGGGGGAEEPVEITDDQLGALEQANSPEEYSQASEDLPDTIKTPGEPPPIDRSGPIGDGGDATVIK